MFIHFGMSTFDGDELSKGDKSSSSYRPDKLDVDQWVSVARDAGMKYAVLTAKHVAGHCLWPSRHTDYHVATSGNKTNGVEAFVTACAKRGVKPGLYYCSWDNHHRFGSVTPTFARWDSAFTTQAYRDFQLVQVEELLTQFGRLSKCGLISPACSATKVGANSTTRLPGYSPTPW
jgi:alpha-L-fucosidase